MRAKFSPDLDTRCAICMDTDETLYHIVVGCPHLQPPALPTGAVVPSEALAMALGLHSEGAPGGQTEAIEDTKQCLEHWWRDRV